MRATTWYITKDGKEINLHILNPEKYPQYKDSKIRINGIGICGELPEDMSRPVKVRVKMDIIEEG